MLCSISPSVTGFSPSQLQSNSGHTFESEEAFIVRGAAGAAWYCGFVFVALARGLAVARSFAAHLVLWLEQRELDEDAEAVKIALMGPLLGDGAATRACRLELVLVAN